MIEILFQIIAGLVNLILWLFLSVLILVGWVFDAVIGFTVLRFSNFINGIQGLETAWTVVRDVANMTFIFVLIFIAINVSLGSFGASTVGNTKKTIASILVVALLVNFSGVLTRVVIDFSNVLSFGFYQSIKPADGSIAWKLYQELPLQNSKAYTWMNKTIREQGAKKISQPRPIKTEADGLLTVILIGFASIVLILVTSFVLLVASILFFIRLTILSFLYVLSPLALASSVIPKMEGVFSKWWNTLWNQALFAPAYMFCIYLTFRILDADTLKNLLTTNPTTRVSAYAGAASILLTFAMVIVLMLASIFLAKSMSAFGSDFAVKWGGKLNSMLSSVPSYLTKKGLSLPGAGYRALEKHGQVPTLSNWEKGIRTKVGDVWDSKFMQGVRGSELGRGVGEAKKELLGSLSKPLKAVNEKLSDTALKGAFLGDTEKVKREAEKAAKEAKDREKEAKLKEDQQKLDDLADNLAGKNLATLDTSPGNINSKAQADAWLQEHKQHEEANKELIEKIKGINLGDLVKMDKKKLLRNEVAAHLTPSQIDALMKEKKLAPKDLAQIKEASTKAELVAQRLQDASKLVHGDGSDQAKAADSKFKSAQEKAQWVKTHIHD